MRLRSHLVILALGAALPLLVFSIVVVRQDYADQRVTLERGMRSTARALSLAVDGEVKASLAMLETLAASAALDSGDLKAFHALCRRTIEGRTNAYIILFDLSGRPLLNSSRPFGASLPHPLFTARSASADPRYPAAPVGGAAPIEKVLETSRPVVSNLFVSLVTRQPRVSLDIPVLRSGTMRYVLELSLDPDVFVQLLVKHHVAVDSVVNIVDRNGLAIARSLDPAGRVGRPLAPALASQIAGADEGSGTGHTVEGMPVYHVFTRSTTTGWTTSLAVSQLVFGRSLRRSVGLLAEGVAVALLLGGSLAFVIGRRIATPISTLARSAASLARGESAELDATAVREVRDLRDTLVMAGAAIREVASERHDREMAEAAERRASFWGRATTALASSLEYEDTLAAVADLVVSHVADGCAFDVAGEMGTIRRVALRHRDPETQAIWSDASRRYPPDADDLVQKTMATRRLTLRPFVDDAFLFELARDADHLAMLRAVDFRALIVAPIISRDVVVGALTLVSSALELRFETADVALAEDLAVRVGYAIDNARLYREAKLAREAADRANRTKDEFLTVLSHELRTPLNAVYGWARMLRAGQVPPASVEGALEAIVRNANAQVQLIDDLLDMSRVIAGKMRLDVHAVDLAPIVEAALEGVRPAAVAKGIKLESVLDPHAGPVMGDATRLQQVAWNLLMNAIKFTPRGGRIQLRLLRADSHVEVVTSDTGQGIAADLLPFIFDRFRQGDSSSTRAQAGLGLGLALVKHLVELHGGSVVAESAGEGKGATFVVKLPLTIAQTAGAGPGLPPVALPAAPSATPCRLHGLRILVVDDDGDSRDLLAAMLVEVGAAVRTCSSAIAALDIVQEWRPDVLVSDIEMPEEDGYTLIRKVRALDADHGGKIPAVALTAYGRIQDRSVSLTAGYNIHVPKPADPAELTALIAGLAAPPVDATRTPTH